MKHRRKILFYKIFAVIFGVLVLFLTGDGVKNPEINRRSLAIVMGIDGKAGEISASVQIIVPQPQGQGKQMIVNEKGKTLSDALDRINISIGQKVELGHCGLIILGQDYAKEGVFPELTFLLSGGKTSPSVNLVVAKDMQAKEVLSKLNDLSKVVSEGINSIVSYADYGVHITKTGVLKFLSDSYTYGKSSAIPFVELGVDKYGGEGSGSGSENKNGGGAKNEGSPSQEGGESKPQGQTVIKGINALAAFKGGVMTGEITPEAAKGMVWLEKNAVTGLVLLEDIRLADKTIDSLSCKLIGKKVKTKAEFRDGKPIFKVSISLKVSVEDKYKITDIVENGKKEIYKVVEEAFTKLIKREIGEALAQSKALGCDVMCLNEKFNKFCHKQFAEYGDILQSVSAEYEVSVNIL